jgi:enamine deaminase RidA (YjgF/YER057c/UK114 family)
LKAAGSEPADVARVTCFLSALDQGQQVRQMFGGEYPQAAFDYVQIQRTPARAVVECEAVAKLRWQTGTTLHLLNPDGLTKSPNYSQIAMVAAARVVLTSAQVSFGFQDSDAQLAFQRLDKVLEQFGTSLRQAAMVHFYPLSQSLAQGPGGLLGSGASARRYHADVRGLAFDGRGLRGGCNRGHGKIISTPRRPGRIYAGPGCRGHAGQRKCPHPNQAVALSSMHGVKS